jgi:DNA end-binding protein Ku
MLDLATHIIGRKLDHFDPKRFEDRYQNALLEIIRAKQQHRPVTTSSPTPKAGNVVSLMDALRKSIAAEGAANDAGQGPEKAAPARRAKAKAPEPAAPTKPAHAKSPVPPKPAAAAKAPARSSAKAPAKAAGRLRRAG